MKRAKRWMKRVIGLAWVFLLAVSSVGLIPARAEGGAKSTDTPVDFVLVLDCSGSMNENDKERLTVSAAKMFVDMLPAENARLAAVVFGADYGEDAYPVNLNADDPQNYSVRRVKVACPLGSITELDEKQNAKNILEEELKEPPQGEDRYTPIGYALNAAVRILEDGSAEDDSAAIILISDGEISGQGEQDKYNEGYDYHSVDDATAQAASHGWPIYGLEMDYYKKHDDPQTAAAKIAKHQMREVIPNNTFGFNIPLIEAAQAQDAFAEIFAKFFDAVPTASSGTITNGEVALDFSIAEMIAETNLTITGDISNVTDIDIVDGRGSTQNFARRTEEERVESDNNRIVTFGDKYVTVKLMAPEEGDWRIVAHGTDGVEIGLYAVSIRELNLQLYTDISESEMISKGTQANFTASFVYHGTNYPASKFYQKYRAYLVVEETGDIVELTGGESNYTTSEPFVFGRTGAYTVKAVVESDLFRNGKKESGAYVFNVGNKPPYTLKEIEDQTVGVGQSFVINCGDYFKDEDDPELDYTFELDAQSAGATYELNKETGELTVTAGVQSGDYIGTIRASDGTSSGAELTFGVKVENQPMTLAKGLEDGDTVSVDFSYNAGSLPGFLMNLAHIPEESEKTLRWSDYFEDPDGLPLNIAVSAEDEATVITMSYDAESMHVSASEKGQAIYRVTASDGSDSAIASTLTVKVNSCDAKALLWKAVRIPVFLVLALLIAVIALLIYAFTGKKIYGKWDVITSAKTVKDRRFFVTGAGRHAKCSLNSLLKDLGLQGDFQGVELVAGNKLGKKVTLRGFDKLKEVAVNGSRVTDPARLKKLSVTIRPGKSVTLLSATNAKVKLERKTK